MNKAVKLNKASGPPIKIIIDSTISHWFRLPLPTNVKIIAIKNPNPAAQIKVCCLLSTVSLSILSFEQYTVLRLKINHFAQS